VRLMRAQRLCMPRHQLALRRGRRAPLARAAGAREPGVGFACRGGGSGPRGPRVRCAHAHAPCLHCLGRAARRETRGGSRRKLRSVAEG
jgi:hypothetical protein